MAPKQLRCRELKGGDIMLQNSLGNFGGRAIALGQYLAGEKHTQIIHAGIMYDASYIIEALDAGIQANDLRVGNRDCGYTVYRARTPMLGTVAGNLAKLLFDTHGDVKNLKYAWIGAVESLGGAGNPAKSNVDLDRMVDKIFSAKSNRFFCSQFVVAVYQISAGQLGMKPSSVFAMDDARVAPARLASILETSPVFDQVGVMNPRER